MVQHVAWFQLSAVSTHTRNLISGNTQTHLVPHQIYFNGLINVSCTRLCKHWKKTKIYCPSQYFIPPSLDTNQTVTTLLAHRISRDVFTHHDHADLLWRSLSNIINQQVIKLQGHPLYILRVPVNGCTAHACRVWDVLTSLSRVSGWSCLDIFLVLLNILFLFHFLKRAHFPLSAIILWPLIGMQWFISCLWFHIQVSLRQMLNAMYMCNMCKGVGREILKGVCVYCIVPDEQFVIWYGSLCPNCVSLCLWVVACVVRCFEQTRRNALYKTSSRDFW